MGIIEYILRKIDREFWYKVKAHAHRQNKSLRELIMSMLVRELEMQNEKEES